MKQIRFYTPEMGQVGHTRWLREGEKWPSLDWSKVTAIETSETLPVDEFKKRHPFAQLPDDLQ